LHYHWEIYDTAIINDTIQRTQALRTAAAHIYAGQETVLTISIGEGDFTAAIPLTGTAGLGGSAMPGGSSRVIRRIRDTGYSLIRPGGKPRRTIKSGKVIIACRSFI
jgi:hypothetical protein